MSAARLDPRDFAPGFKAHSYWLEDADFPELTKGTLPNSVDALVIGAGYTGLMAATELARGGRSVLVAEAGQLGHGCSARNGGQVSTSIKPGFSTLSKLHGEEIAYRVRREGFDALKGLEELVRDEQLDADWRPVGRYYALHSEAALKDLESSLRSQPKGLEIAADIVPKSEIRDYLGSEMYPAGAIYHAPVAVQPAKLLAAIARRALAAGVRMETGMRVGALSRDGKGFEADTPKGRIRARQVLVATNGYTGPLTPWHQRRIIPINSAMLATEDMDPALVERLIPKGRLVVDSRKLVLYFRPSPDGRRIVFGGRAGVFDLTAEKAVPRLLGMMRRVFPETRSVRAEFGWTGTVAYTFDQLPHLGEHEGIHYCIGYCGSGVSLSTHFGRRIGLQMLGRPEGRTALDAIPFRTLPLYTGKPWFLAPSILAYRMLDRIGRY
jgi:glycine/D-amino acid oxidase-like deaminating enzyme